MTDKKWITVRVRTSRRIRATLKMVVAEVGQGRAFSGRKGVLTQETFIAAAWMWMKSLDPEELAEKVAPFVATAEEALAAVLGAEKKSEADQLTEAGKLVARRQVLGVDIVRHGDGASESASPVRGPLQVTVTEVPAPPEEQLAKMRSEAIAEPAEKKPGKAKKRGAG